MVEVLRWETKTMANSLENLMKQGLSDNYWNETIFQAYVNHNQTLFILKGCLMSVQPDPITPMSQSLHHYYRIALYHEQRALTGRQ